MLPRLADSPSLFQSHGRREARPRAGELVDRLISALERRGGWVSARVLCEDLGVDDRAIRQAASSSGGRVLSGQRGYIETARASLAELQRCTSALLSQSARLRHRVLEIERVRHAGGAS